MRVELLRVVCSGEVDAAVRSGKLWLVLVCGAEEEQKRSRVVRCGANAGTGWWSPAQLSRGNGLRLLKKAHKLKVS